MKSSKYCLSFHIILISIISCFRIVISAEAVITKVGQWGAGNYQDIFIDGSYAYCAAYTTGIDVIDISDPSNPVFVSSIDTSVSAPSVFVSGNYAYVTDGGAGLKIIDISTPSAPFLVGFYDTSGLA